jgi:hypothetical protein
MVGSPSRRDANALTSDWPRLAAAWQGGVFVAPFAGGQGRLSAGSQNHRCLDCRHTFGPARTSSHSALLPAGPVIVLNRPRVGSDHLAARGRQ